MTIDHIRQFLAGRTRQQITSPELTTAGVLMVLFHRENDLRILLTKRTSDVEHHKGQISFPGGSRDEGDRDIISTALREAEEEIGLSRKAVEVLGLLDDVWTPSGFRITPVIAYAPRLPQLHPSGLEVEQILEVPIHFFQNRANEEVRRLYRSGKWVDVYFYKHEGHEIWGATAAIIHSFLSAFRESEQPGG